MNNKTMAIKAFYSEICLIHNKKENEKLLDLFITHLSYFDINTIEEMWKRSITNSIKMPVLAELIDLCRNIRTELEDNKNNEKYFETQKERNKESEEERKKNAEYFKQCLNKLKLSSNKNKMPKNFPSEKKLNKYPNLKFNQDEDDLPF